jgi:hypothetical protein
MPEPSTNWQSPDGLQNAQALNAMHPSVFSAIAEIDNLGHQILKRAIDAADVSSVDRIVGLSLLRRLITAFVGIRHLLEASAVQPALILARSQFEVFLSLQYLVHGGHRRPSLRTPSSLRRRDTRARFFMAASIRSGIYRRQAVLDGKEGLGRRLGRGIRRALTAEIQSEIGRLRQHYAAQDPHFGPFCCYPTGGTKPRYHDSSQWYSFGFRKKTVNSVKALATQFGFLKMYSLIYGPLSDLGHARGIQPDVTIGEGRAEIHSPYNPDAFEFVAYFACTWQLLALAYAAKAYCPEGHSDLQRTDQAVHHGLASIQAAAASTVFL